MDDWTCRIAVAQCNGIGPKTYHALARKLEAKGLSFGDLFSLDADDLMREFALTASAAENIVDAAGSVDEVTAAREGMSERGIEVLPAGMPGYPEKCRLWMGDMAPPLLYTLGPLELVEQKGIGIVGSREASDEGMRIAAAIGRRLAEERAVVVSGYAPGIDAHGHLGALEKGGGTIACLPDGIERFRLRPELREVFENGSMLVLSQHPPHQPWTSGGAMARNLLICALSDAVIVVEAQLGGGTMHSAEVARDMGKPVFVVQLEPLPEGNRALIQGGATAVRVGDPIDLSGVLAAEPAPPESQQPALFNTF